MQDTSDSGLNRKQRRTRDMVAHARRKRLGTCTDRKYDNRVFTISQLGTTGRRSCHTTLDTDTTQATTGRETFSERYMVDRAVLNGLCSRRSKNG